MIGRLLGLAEGRVGICVRGPALTRFFNACAAQEIVLHRICRTDWNEMHAEVSLADYRRLPRAMGRTGCRVRACRRMGLPFLLHTLQPRVALWCGGLALLVLFYVLTTRIWTIDVQLEPGLPRGEIMEQLDALGVHIGAERSTMDVRAVRRQVMRRHPELAFFALNICGNRLTVTGVQGKPVPEMTDLRTAAKIVATRDGVLAQMSVEEGAAQVRVGDAVTQGQTLISGLVPPQTETGNYRLCHARGEVWAHTAYFERSARALNVLKKGKVTRVRRQYAVLFGNYRLNLYFGSGISGGSCDKILSVKSVALSDSVTIPIRLLRQEYRFYDVAAQQLTVEDVRAEMRERLLRHFASEIAGEAIGREDTAHEANGAAIVEVRVRALEQIGAEALDDSTLPEKNEKP